MVGEQSGGRHHIVGGGIASLAAAVFLIRDAAVRGEDITIFERTSRAGGSLDGAGDAEGGYLVRGGRMFEHNFVCTLDLLSSIPSAGDRTRSIRDDIFDFNEQVYGSSCCRIVRNGRCAKPTLGLRTRHLVQLTRLVMERETEMGAKPVEDFFSPDFFETNFWIMWSTTFAFQRWHSAAELARYFRRFLHLFPDFKRLEGVLRTRFNQYDSLVAPIVAWLEERGVRIEKSTEVLDASLDGTGGGRRITGLVIQRAAGTERLAIGERDRVYLTLGSMTEGATIGSNGAPPPPAARGQAWPLWRALAARDPSFGKPSRFGDDIDRTAWESFTVTLRHQRFFDFMEDLTGNRAGTGGLVTFADSAWTLSIVLFHQPHFARQAEDSWVFWGYGLHGDRRGKASGKPMRNCSGEEILAELALELGLGPRADDVFRDAIVRPCMMPLTTSQFMPWPADGQRRQSGDPTATPGFS